MRVWSLVSQKGGSGKSTLSTQLAVVAQQHGEKVIIVDLDPQGSAEVWRRVRGLEEPGAIESLPDRLALVIESAKTLNVSMLILDTPPHSSEVAILAVRASDTIICPTQSSLFDISALRDTINILEDCGAKNRAIAVINSLPTSGTKAAYDDAALPLTQMGIAVAPTGIGHRKAFVTAITQGRCVTEISPKDKASDEIRALWKDLNDFENRPANPALAMIKGQKQAKGKEKTK